MALPDGTQSVNKADEKYIKALEKLIIQQNNDIKELKQSVRAALRNQR